MFVSLSGRAGYKGKKPIRRSPDKHTMPAAGINRQITDEPEQGTYK
jgi:hypothetical protein